MYSLLTKESRLQSQQIQFDSLTNKGYIREDYKGLKMFTSNEGGFFLKVFKDNASNHIEYKNYRTAERRSDAMQNFKDSYDRNLARKAELKNNPTKSSAANCAAAIRSELKEKYPHIKFSVKSDNFSMGNSVDIRWTDGATVDEIEEITGKYQYGHFNGIEDIYEYSNDRTDIPQAKYVHTHRDKSEGVEALLPELEKIGSFDSQDWHNNAQNILHRIFYKTSFPAGAEITGIEKTEITCGQYEDFFRIVFTTPQKEQKTTTQAATFTPPASGKIQIIDYSEKAIAVIGETKPIKEKLKELGGRFNFNLSCGAGWIFPKTKLETIKTALS